VERCNVLNSQRITAVAAAGRLGASRQTVGAGKRGLSLVLRDGFDADWALKAAEPRAAVQRVSDFARANRARRPCPQGPRSERFLGGVVTAPRAWAARRRLLAASTQNGTVAHGGAVSAPGAGDGTGRRLETRLHEPVVAGAAATAS
jgi:hypothetical protein